MIEAIIGAVIGVVGAVIGVCFTYILAERSTRKKEERTEQEEGLELRLYAEIVRLTQDGSVFSPDPESANFRLAMRLHQKGLLERLPARGHNFFTLPGAPIKLDTSQKVNRSPDQDMTQFPRVDLPCAMH